MAFLCRIKQSQLKCLSNQFKRCYFQIHGPCVTNHTVSHSRILIFDKRNRIIYRNQLEFRNNVRFFAAPVQAKQKQEEKDTSGPRLNEQITSEYVRLVTDEGHGIVKRKEALDRARRLNLDLVEVQRHAKPPVCKLMDYHREKYKKQIQEKDRIKSKSEVTLRKGDSKEVRFAGKIEQKDLQMKADMVKRLMERGYRVKCMAMGKEDQDLGGLLSRLSALIEDVSIVESGPRVEKKQAYVIVRHVKFGPSKKGPGKKFSKVAQGTTSTDVQNVAVSSPTTKPSMQPEENLDGAESGLETEDDTIFEETPSSPSREDIENNKSAWSVLDASDEFEKVFDFRGDENGVSKSSSGEQTYGAPEASSSPTNSSSKSMSSRPVLDASRTRTVSSSPSEDSLVIENRYRKEPKNRFPPTKSSDVQGTRAGTEYPNQGRQPRLDSNTSSSTNQTERVEIDASSMFRNLKLPDNEFSKQQDSHPNDPNARSSTDSSYGIFTASKAADVPAKQSTAAETNRYNKKNSPSDSTRNPSLSTNPSPNTSKYDGTGRQGVRQGKWGIFGSENSNMNPNRNTESQSKVQR